MPCTDYAELSALLSLNQLPLSDRRPLVERFQAKTPFSEIRRQILFDHFLDRAEKLKNIESRFDPMKEIQTANELGIRLIDFSSPEYPTPLRRIYHPPLVLYVRGDFYPEDEDAIAIVGTRHPSFYGIEQTRRFSRALSEKGLTIVSGLAAGVDQAAHEAAMEVSYGRTLAVLGCGLDQAYPSGSQALKDKISKRGAIISEYPLGTEPLARNFPQRNRIISGLSLGVLVMEAHYRSGALITAHEALDESKDVFAVPGPVNQWTSRGTHRLLKEGAYLAENPEDIMEVLAPVLSMKGKDKAALQDSIKLESENPEKSELPGKEIPGLVVSKKENHPLVEFLKMQPATCEEWIENSGLAPTAALSQLTLLELQGMIIKQPSGRFALASCNSNQKQA